MAIDPKHKYYFELYFHLGVNRSVSRLAKLQMPRLYPEIPQNSKEYQRNFNALYMKFRRWEVKENWGEEAEKLQSDNRRQKDDLIKGEETTLSDTVKMYRSMVRHLLQKFAARVASGEVELKDEKAAKRMVELDMYLTRVLDARPKFLPSQVYDLMNEDEKRHADRVFEWLRRQTLKEEAIKDLGGIVRAEATVEMVKSLPSTERIVDVRQLPAFAMKLTEHAESDEEVGLETASHKKYYVNSAEIPGENTTDDEGLNYE